MNYKKYLTEEIWNPVVDTDLGHIEDKIVDVSDPIVIDRHSPIAPVMDIYGKGHQFDIFDNQTLYMIIKIIKDFVDKKIYIRDVAYKLSTDKRKVVFSMITNPNQRIVDYHLDSFSEMIKHRIIQQLGDNFLFDQEIKKVNKDQLELILIVFEKLQTDDESDN